MKTPVPEILCWATNFTARIGQRAFRETRTLFGSTKTQIPELMALTASVLRSIPDREICTYPETTPLYHKLARALSVDPRQLVLAAGSDGVIRSVFEAFVNPGDCVLHTTPTFAMYPVYSAMYDSRPVTLRYKRSDAGPLLDVRESIQLIGEHRPRVVCLPNPDSPTGTIVSEADLKALIDATGAVGSVFLIDEAYYPFYLHSAFRLTEKNPHVVIARTFAKAWGLAGLRIGYAITHPDTAAVLHKVRPMYEVNTVAVAVAERMLDHEDAVLASVARTNAGKNYFLTAMKELGFTTFPTYGNFLYVGFGARKDEIKAALKEIVLYRADSNEDCLSGFSRFSATTVALFQPVVQAIRNIVAR